MRANFLNIIFAFQKLEHVILLYRNPTTSTQESNAESDNITRA